MVYSGILTLSSLSIVIPAYNEEKRLPVTFEKLERFLATPHGWDSIEIVIVDDGSKDATASMVERLAARNPVFRLLKNPGNRGKGFAVKNGALHSSGDWLLVTDADLSAPIEEQEKLITAARQQSADIAIGSRAVDRTLVHVRQPLFREYSGRFFNLVMRLVTGLPFLDTQCGFKLFHRRTVEPIFSRQVIEGFGFDVEDLFLAKKLDYKAVEVPVRWDNVEGTKVSLSSGVNGFLDLLRVRWYQLTNRYR